MLIVVFIAFINERVKFFMSRYDIDEKVRNKYVAIIGKFFNEVDSKTTKDIESMENDSFVLPLSDTELNPYTPQTILELELDFGFKYDDMDMDTNGREMDFWIYLYRETEGLTHKVCIQGTGITFELNLKISVG